MKNRFVNIVLVLVTAFVVLEVTRTANGVDCEPGITKMHLSTTDGEFVDGDSIEIDSTNGLQVKVDDSTIEIDATNGLQITDSYTTAATNYVDSKVKSFGTRISPTITAGSNVQVSADGFLTVWFSCTTEGVVNIYSDTSSTPTTLIATFSAQPNNRDHIGGITVPILKDDYYRVEFGQDTAGTLQGRWVPLS